MAGAPLGSVTATFGADGVARASIGPSVYGAKWHVDRIVVSTTSVLPSTCTVYRNVEAASAQLDHTRTGNADTSETSLDVPSPDALIFVWLGGTPGAVATAVISGTLNTGRTRAIY